jgi:hypothetical protein
MGMLTARQKTAWENGSRRQRQHLGRNRAKRLHYPEAVETQEERPRNLHRRSS